MDGTGVLFEPLIHLIPDSVEYEIYPLQKFEANFPVKQAQELATYLGSEEVIIFAESYSGLIAYELCRLKQNNIKHVIFAASFLECPSFLSKFSILLPLSVVRMNLIPKKLLSYVLFGSLQRIDLVDLFYRSLDKVSNKDLRSRLNIISGLTTATAEIDVPATYICAEKDLLVNRNCIKRFDKLFNHLDIIELKGGHFIAQSNAEECWLSIKLKL